MILGASISHQQEQRTVDEEHEQRPMEPIVIVMQYLAPLLELQFTDVHGEPAGTPFVVQQLDNHAKEQSGIELQLQVRMSVSI